MSGQGAGRRLTPDEERRGAELFAAGKSEREVAAALQCGVATAHRLRQRLAERAASRSEPEDTVTEQAPDELSNGVRTSVAEDQADDAELTRLRGRQDELAAEVGMYAERAESSRQAVAALEAERLQLLSAGHDAQQLRPRRRNAEDDFTDAADAARIAQGALAVVGEQIAAIEARQADRQLREDLAAAVAERDRVLATIGARQRAAVLAVRAAAEEIRATVAEEQAAVERVEQLAGRIALGGPVPTVPPAVSTGLSVPPDYVAAQPVHLMRALSAAHQGMPVERICEELGAVAGWLPPDPAELEAERQRLIALRAGAPVPQPSVPGLPVRQIDPRYGSTVNLDENGNPLMPRPPQQELAVPGAQQATPFGWLGGQPFR